MAQLAALQKRTALSKHTSDTSLKDMLPSWGGSESSEGSKSSEGSEGSGTKSSYMQGAAGGVGSGAGAWGETQPTIFAAVNAYKKATMSRQLSVREVMVVWGWVKWATAAQGAHQRKAGRLESRQPAQLSCTGSTTALPRSTSKHSRQASTLSICAS